MLLRGRLELPVSLMQWVDLGRYTLWGDLVADGAEGKFRLSLMCIQTEYATSSIYESFFFWADF